MPTIFEPYSKEQCARCSEYPHNADKENNPYAYERSREFRIKGYCSTYCKDMAEVEDREKTIRKEALQEAADVAGAHKGCGVGNYCDAPIDIKHAILDLENKDE